MGNIIQQDSTQQVREEYVKKKGFKLFLIRFFYMLVLSLSITYTIFRVIGETIFQAITYTGIVFTLPIIFIIGFALAMWRFWYSIPWFILATVVVNSFMFGFGGLGLSAIEIPIFLVVTLVVLGIEKMFSKISLKWLRMTLALLPFIIMAIIIIIVNITCSFGNNSECIAKNALEQNNPNLCETTGYKLYDCYRRFFEEEISLSLCEQIKNTESKYFCYFALGKKTKDLTICDKIIDRTENAFKEECYIEVGVAKLDDTICDRIVGDDYSKYNCYSEIVWSGGDVSICEKIRNEAAKLSCLNPENIGWKRE